MIVVGYKVVFNKVRGALVPDHAVAFLTASEEEKRCLEMCALKEKKSLVGDMETCRHAGHFFLLVFL